MLGPTQELQRHVKRCCLWHAKELLFNCPSYNPIHFHLKSLRIQAQKHKGREGGSPHVILDRRHAITSLRPGSVAGEEQDGALQLYSCLRSKLQLVHAQVKVWSAAVLLWPPPRPARVGLGMGVQPLAQTGDNQDIGWEHIQHKIITITTREEAQRHTSRFLFWP